MFGAPFFFFSPFYGLSSPSQKAQNLEYYLPVFFSRFVGISHFPLCQHLPPPPFPLRPFYATDGQSRSPKCLLVGCWLAPQPSFFFLFPRCPTEKLEATSCYVVSRFYAVFPPGPFSYPGHRPYHPVNRFVTDYATPRAVESSFPYFR